MRRTRLPALLMLLAWLALGGCSKTDGCQSDNDCKGDRICEAGQCVASPAKASTAGASEAPAPAVEPTDEPAPPVEPPKKPVPASPEATPTPPAPKAQRPALNPRLRGAPRLGARSPLVVVTEFGDFRCPYCARSTTVVGELLKRQGKADGDVTFEWRHNPLELYPGSEGLARAAVAAQLQGRFWQLHDQLFTNRKKSNTPSELVRLAQLAGLDVARWEADRSSAAVTQRVRRDRHVALALGAVGTPTFFVNGRPLVGAPTAERLSPLIADELRKAAAKLDAGMKRADVANTLTRENNKEYARYLLDGVAPKAPERKSIPVPETVWQVLVRPDDPSLGPAKAMVTLIEFADLQCPFCARYQPVLKQLLAAYPKDLRLVFKHNPLAFHPQARLAAEAAVAAHRGGKFWAYHDRLLEQQDKLAPADLETHATAVGLAPGLVQSAIGTRKYRGRVEADQALAARVKAVGTPILFVNGRKVAGARPLAELRKLVDEELLKARKLVAAGTPRAALYQKIVGAGKRLDPLGGKPRPFDVGAAPAAGPADAPIQLVVFADFQCPYSSRLAPILDRVSSTFDGKVRLAFKHFPQDYHPDAKHAAIAGVCAQAQGRFWDLYRQLFDLAKQKKLSPSDVRAYAKLARVNLAVYDRCIAAKEAKARVAADVAEGKAAGVTGTPTVFINGRRFRSATGYNDRSFTAIFNEVLGKKAKTP